MLGFPIGYVSVRVGLSPHVIRAWERRYGAIKPARTEGGRRIYGEDEIARLALLKQATEHGYRISHVAGLSREKLTALLSQSSIHDGSDADRTAAADPIVAQKWIEACLAATAALDVVALLDQLQQARQLFGRLAFLQNIVVPFLRRVGQRWASGEYRIVNGHIAATTVHKLLSSMLVQDPTVSVDKPRLLTTTPAGQNCELGAMAVAVIATNYGWESFFLGPNLPSEEIVAAQTVLRPQLIALSITCRAKKTFLTEELNYLTQRQGKTCQIAIGGRAAGNYRQIIETAGARFCATTEDLVALLT